MDYLTTNPLSLANVILRSVSFSVINEANGYGLAPVKILNAIPFPLFPEAMNCAPLHFSLPLFYILVPAHITILWQSRAQYNIDVSLSQIPSKGGRICWVGWVGFNGRFTYPQ
jgi:hypothetical protein